MWICPNVLKFTIYFNSRTHKFAVLVLVVLDRFAGDFIHR